MTTNFKAGLQKFVTVIAVLFALFQITIVLKPFDALSLRSVHLGFVLVLVFLVNGILKKENPTKYDYIWNIAFAIIGVVGCVYLFTNAYELTTDRQGLYTNWDLLFGSLMIIGVLAATWRIYGAPISIIIGCSLLYMFFGQNLPTAVAHPGITIPRAISNLSLFTEGIFGPSLGASASVIAAFIIFAAFIQVSGGADLFMDLAVAVFGRFTGGAAKIAVVASTLFGMISGSAAANTAGTGMITIPLMKKSGFEAHVAAAVEASASSGGQIMPPIMGAAAFIVAEMLGVPYVQVMMSALIPALIYYAAIFMGVHLYSVKNDIKGAPIETKDFKKLILTRGHSLIPLVILMYFIAIVRITPQMAALYSTVSIIVISYLRKETRFSLTMIKDGLYNGAVGILEISIICAAAGIILGVFTVTGLGLKMSSVIVTLAGGSLFALLLLAMIASLILGMGLPTVAAYLVLAILVAPAMIDFGVVPMAAHLFVFYFGIISAITPPVAIAAYVGAGISGSNPFKVGFTACGLAFPAFLIPYVFAYQPALLLLGEPLAIIQVVATTVFASLLCAAFYQGFIFTKLAKYERALMLIAALLLMVPEGSTDIIGLVVSVAVLFKVYMRSKKEKAKPAVAV